MFYEPSLTTSSLLIGAFTFLGLFLFVLYAGRKDASLRTILIAALTFRTLILVIHNFFVPLPGGTADAVSFERTAWEWAQQGLPHVLEQFTGPHSYFYSVKLAVFYSLLDRSSLGAQNISILAGLGAVVFIYHAVYRIWGYSAAQKAGWLAALLPLFSMYSTFPRREAFVYFFAAAGGFYAISWSMTYRARYLLLAIVMFTAGIFYHAAFLLGILGLLTYAITHHFYAKLLKKGRLSTTLLLGLAIALAGGSYLVRPDVTLPEFGDITETVIHLDEVVLDYAERRARDAAAYPSWAIPDSPLEAIFLSPFRVMYFFGGPFVWDISRPLHLIGFADAIIFLALLVLAFRRRKELMANPATKLLISISLPMILAFALISSNFGTSMRHRQKFIPFILMVCAPALPRIRFGTPEQRQPLNRRKKSDLAARLKGFSGNKS